MMDAFLLSGWGIKVPRNADILGLKNGHDMGSIYISQKYNNKRLAFS